MSEDRKLPEWVELVAGEIAEAYATLNTRQAYDDIARMIAARMPAGLVSAITPGDHSELLKRADDAIYLLRNGGEDDPYVVDRPVDIDHENEHDEGDTRIEVADGQDWCIVPANEGQPEIGTAHAIAGAGKLIYDLRAALVSAVHANERDRVRLVVHLESLRKAMGSWRWIPNGETQSVEDGKLSQEVDCAYRAIEAAMEPMWVMGRDLTNSPGSDGRGTGVRAGEDLAKRDVARVPEEVSALTLEHMCDVYHINDGIRFNEMGSNDRRHRMLRMLDAIRVLTAQVKR